MLSEPAFVSLQSFSRQLGTSEARTQETNVLVSGGLTPIRSVPVSLTLVAPASHIAELDAASSRKGFEDLVLGARYRLDIAPLQRRFDRSGNFLLVMAAVELPTGSIDHPPFKGPLDEMLALLYGVEWRSFSAIAYGFYRLHGRDSAGLRAGDNLFVGGGLAYTPWDDPATERLLSFQLGFSHETYFQDEMGAEKDPSTGGTAAMVHPTLVWGPGGHVLVFAMASLPIWRSFANPADQDRWRVGAGLIYFFGH
jgi:hypothetical protein